MILAYHTHREAEREPIIDARLEEFAKRYPGAHEVHGALTVVMTTGRVTTAILVRGSDRLDATLIDGHVTDVETASNTLFREAVWRDWLKEALSQ